MSAIRTLLPRFTAGPHVISALSGKERKKRFAVTSFGNFDCLYLVLASSQEAATPNAPKLRMTVMATEYSREQGHPRTPPQTLERGRVQSTLSECAPKPGSSPPTPRADLVRTACLCTSPPAWSALSRVPMAHLTARASSAQPCARTSVMSPLHASSSLGTHSVISFDPLPFPSVVCTNARA